MVHEFDTMQQLVGLIIKLIIYVPPILFAITLHEVAHGSVALRCGDSTAYAAGRLSLNPLRHVDPVGTVLVPGMLLIFGGFIFGWAKPVPVNYAYLRHPKQDMALVALAGPTANLAMAIGWGLAIVTSRIVTAAGLPLLGALLHEMGVVGIFINISFGVLNMLPVPPLDGSRVLAGVLPDAFGKLMMRLEPYGLLIVFALLVTGIIKLILLPPINLLLNFMFSIFS